VHDLVFNVSRKFELAFFEMLVNVLQEKHRVVCVATLLEPLEELLHVGDHLGQVALGVV
jgi:hypothetical protein